MGTTTLSKTAPERPAASTYWRRRFVALVIGLSVLAAVTWVVSGLTSGSSPAPDRAATRTVHGRLPGPAPTSGHGTAQQHGSGSHPGGARQQHGPAVAAASMLPCPAADVVLSVFSSQASYSIRQSPEFQVDIVSVDNQTCTFDIGARHVWLQITAGQLRVWSSAECAEGNASLVTELRRGVPTVVPIGWDGQISGPGCPGPSRRAASGNYVAVASDGSSSSSSLAFHVS